MAPPPPSRPATSPGAAAAPPAAVPAASADLKDPTSRQRRRLEDDAPNERRPALPEAAAARLVLAAALTGAAAFAAATLRSTPPRRRSPLPQSHSALELGSLASTETAPSLLDPAVDSNLADLDDPPEPSYETPFFWHVPKAAGTTMQTILVSCWDLTVANGVGRGHDDDESLRIIQPPGLTGHYVNVDTASPPGIEHAASLRLSESGLADVVVSPRFVPAASLLFDPPYRGRLFALFRHPVDRAVSKFYYLQKATWEPSYRPEWRNMTLREYVRENASSGRDWMVHVLAGRTRGPATEDDLEAAKEVLRRKCLVGLVDRMGESVRRFETYFGWDHPPNPPDEAERRRRERCTSKLSGGGGGSNRHAHPRAEEGSEEWELLVGANQLDVRLYEYAEGLFEEQGRLFDEDEEDET